MSLMRVTAVDYATTDPEDDEMPEPILKVVGRGKEKRRVHYVYGTRPYLYVPVDQEVKPFDYQVIDEEEGYRATDPRPEYNDLELKKWVCRVPGDVGEIANELPETWESDIPYYRRASIDFDLSGYVDMPDEQEVHVDDIETDVQPDADEEIEARAVVGDIEVLHSGESFEQMVEDASGTITNITLYDTYEECYDAYVLDPERRINGNDVGRYLKNNGIDPQEVDIRMHYAGSEEALLDSFLGYFEDRRPDLTTGWNWVSFDIHYLIRRIKRLYEENDEEDVNLNLNRLSDAGYTKRNVGGYHGDLARAVVGVPAVDMMQLFAEKMVRESWRSKALDYVSEQVLGRGKIDDITVREGYHGNRAKLAAYNIVDVELCVGIDEERGVIEFFQQLAELAQVQIYDVFSEMRLVDGFLMAHSKDNEVLPPQPDDSDIPENAGGLVLEPSKGIEEWIGVMDLKSLYPSAMITWNISPETVGWYGDFEGDPDLTVPWVPEASEVSYPVTEDDIDWYRLGTSLDHEGIVPKYLKMLFSDREEMKSRRNESEPGTSEYETWDRKQYAIKVLMNSFYGVSSNDHWRLGKHGLGDAITSASRYALFKGKQIVERVGYDVSYGDTDSCFFRLARPGGPSKDERYKEKAVLDGKGLVNQVNSGMEEAIRDSGLDGDHPYMSEDLPHATDSHCLKYEFEKLYRRYIQIGKKKRYAGLIVWKEGKDVDDIDITGFESQRSDTPELAAEIQEEVLRMVLEGFGVETVREYVSGLCDEIANEEVELPRIARPKSLAKARENYDSKGNQTLKACRASEEQLDKNWVQGDDPFLIYLKETPVGEPNVSVIALEWNEELPGGYEIDPDEHIRIAVKLPLAPILDEMGWSWLEVKTGRGAGDALSGDWGDPETEVTATETEGNDEKGRSFSNSNTVRETSNASLQEEDDEKSGSDDSEPDALGGDW